MSKIVYKALYGYSNVEFAKGLINIFPFGVIGQRNQNKVKPHIHNEVFQIFLITKGETILLHNNTSYSVKAPAFITIPKNAEHGFEHQNEVDGWILSVSDHMLENMINTEAKITSALDKFMIVPFSSSKPIKKLFKALSNCVEEYNSNKVGRLTMLQYLLGQIVVLLYRMNPDKAKTLESTNNTASIYYRRFEQLIKENRSYKKGIEEYASLLNITTGHLNKISKNISGKSPKEIIIDYFIKEAKILLSNPLRNITDISFELGFEDPSYFSRLFKKKTNLSPKEFKEIQNNSK